MSFDLPNVNKKGEPLLRHSIDHISIEHFLPKDLFGGEEPSLTISDLSQIISNFSKPFVAFDKRSLVTDAARYYYDLIIASVNHDVERQQIILNDDARNWLILEKTKRVRDNLVSAIEIQILTEKNEALAGQVNSYKPSGPTFF